MSASPPIPDVLLRRSEATLRIPLIKRHHQSPRRCGRAATAAFRAHAMRRNARHSGWVALELKSRPNLRAPGAAEALRRFSSGFEGGVSILRRHRDGRLDFRQTASRRSGQYPQRRRLFSSGNSAMTSQSWWPKVKSQPMSLPPTLSKSLATASSRFFGLASMPLTASTLLPQPRQRRIQGTMIEAARQAATSVAPLATAAARSRSRYAVRVSSHHAAGSRAEELTISNRFRSAPRSRLRAA